MSPAKTIFLLLCLVPLGAAAADRHWFLSGDSAPDSGVNSQLAPLPARFALLPGQGWHELRVDGGYRAENDLSISARYFDMRYGPASKQSCSQLFACQSLPARYASATVSGFSARLSQGLDFVPALSVYGSFGLMRMDWRFPALHDLPQRPHTETMLFQGVGVRYRFHGGPWIELDTERFQVDMSVTRINFTWQP